MSVILCNLTSNSAYLEGRLPAEEDRVVGAEEDRVGQEVPGRDLGHLHGAFVWIKVYFRNFVRSFIESSDKYGSIIKSSLTTILSTG